MKSKAQEALLLAKLGKRNPSLSATTGENGMGPTATTGSMGVDLPTATTGENPMGATTNTSPAADLLKTIKIKENATQKINTQPRIEGDVDFGPTEVFSPIKSYMKKKRS